MSLSKSLNLYLKYFLILSETNEIFQVIKLIYLSTQNPSRCTYKRQIWAVYFFYNVSVE